MRDSKVYRYFANAYGQAEVSRRQKRLQSRTQDLGVYFCSTAKPPVVTGRSFALFYRSRVIWNALQVLFFGALAVWTVKNYLAVIRGL